ncbi:hypothetical protein ACP70R_033086 [Stipagrostis hirtigluma subsp. patula]
MAAAAARAHVERIRRERFYVGREERNPLAEDIHQAVSYLSEELYSKDVHFLMEHPASSIRTPTMNAEDNEYPLDVAPALEFVITKKDITATGADSTLLVFNNERGFSSANIESICRIGKSTKKGNRHLGYIGEKGIGFKSVFLVSSQPHIFSNGYQIKFSEEPSADCDIGYIVPEWVDGKPNLDDIQEVYGYSKSLPTTTIILPLKTDKILAVKEELSSTHPEILLFLSKIKQLSVREINDDPKATKISQISISSEVDYKTRKDVDAESYTLHLAMQENGKGEEDECTYYMWKQKFAVKPECRIQKRMEVDQWVITLAFPHGKRLSKGARSPSVYAFLPTEMVTNLPFIIQADFILASSRESILFDNKWNRGILDCVPSAFVKAFGALLKSSSNAPLFALPPIFRFLPIEASSISLFDSIRLSIKNKIAAEDIIPCESCTTKKVFCKPTEVSRLDRAFWRILNMVQKLGINLRSLSSHGTFVLSSYLDCQEYDNVLKFLGIGYADYGWYSKFIEGSNLMKEVPEEVYLELLSFVAENWWTKFTNTYMKHVPLVKYVGGNGALSYYSVECIKTNSVSICLAPNVNDLSWLICWNQDLSGASGLFFMPLSTQGSLNVLLGRRQVMDWLQNVVRSKVLTPYEYAILVAKALNTRRLVLVYCHFLHHSHEKKYITDGNITKLCCAMPVVDNNGYVINGRSSLLVPAKGSKWAALMVSNPWRAHNYIELSADYTCAGTFAGNCTSEDQLMSFLRTYAHAVDLPFMRPPNASFPNASSPLTMENALLLLQWIRNLRSSNFQLPQNFLSCIRNGKWLKTSNGYSAPSESFLTSAEWGKLLQTQSAFVALPMIDQEFYGNNLNAYKVELGAIGVMFEFADALVHIGNHFMSISTASTLSQANLLSLLNFIRYLNEKHLTPVHLIERIKNHCWLKTSLGYRSPVSSILFDSEWEAASAVSSLPFVHSTYYGGDIFGYKRELELLGVLTGFKQNYQLVIDNFKFPTNPITNTVTIFMVKCVRYAAYPQDFLKRLKEWKWLKTNAGFRSPAETFHVEDEWKCLLKIVDAVPLLDLDFYGDEIMLYLGELRKAGLVTSLEGISNGIACRIRQLLYASSFTMERRLALLACYRELSTKLCGLPGGLTNLMHCEKWLNTSLGFRAPKEAILFGPEWGPISQICSLPFVGDNNSQKGMAKEIYSYRNELISLGATTGLEQGAAFVISGLNIPNDASSVTAEAVNSLLKCIRNWRRNGSALPNNFMVRIATKWVKTTAGYRQPNGCLLFDSSFSSFLHMKDGPFIDEAFYGQEVLVSFKNELETLGVIVNARAGCALMAQHLTGLSNTDAISRIYSYLEAFHWRPYYTNDNWIWIPKGINEGQWVNPTGCVLYDNCSLFSSQLHVLVNWPV